MQILARTNKATVYQADDGFVAKQYHTDDAASRIASDDASLRFLSDTMSNCEDHDGWSYLAVKPVRIDYASSTIWLEKAPGHAIMSLNAKDVCEAQYRVGIWLAAYHKRVFGSNINGIIFGDATVHNFVVDFERKIATAFDPGLEWGKSGNRYQDIIRYVYSIVVTLVIRKKRSMRTVSAFMRGYAVGTGQALDVNAYVVAVADEYRRQWAAYGRKSRGKQWAFVLATIPWLLIVLCYAPARIGKKSAKQKEKDHFCERVG